MLNFIVDTDTCTKCGECVRDCIFGVIGMDEYPYITEEAGARCIGCQHCLAVCKPGALSILDIDPANSVSVKSALPDPVHMENLIVNRRSIRRYKKEGVDPALIRHMLEVVAHAPTAVNQQLVRLTVVDDPEVMNKLRERTTTAALAVAREGRLPKGYERIAMYLKGCEEGHDVIFRNAPHLLMASAPEDSLAPMADCHIAMSYFELLASSYGIGTVWNGIAKAIFTGVVPECRTLLGIPEGHMIACVMVFGKPAIRYHRSAQRAGGGIHRVDL